MAAGTVGQSTHPTGTHPGVGCLAEHTDLGGILCSLPHTGALTSGLLPAGPSHQVSGQASLAGDFDFPLPGSLDLPGT